MSVNPTETTVPTTTQHDRLADLPIAWQNGIAIFRKKFPSLDHQKINAANPPPIRDQHKLPAWFKQAWEAWAGPSWPNSDLAASIQFGIAPLGHDWYKLGCYGALHATQQTPLGYVIGYSGDQHLLLVRIADSAAVDHTIYHVTRADCFKPNFDPWQTPAFADYGHLWAQVQAVRISDVTVPAQIPPPPPASPPVVRPLETPALKTQDYFSANLLRINEYTFLSLRQVARVILTDLDHITNISVMDDGQQLIVRLRNNDARDFQLWLEERAYPVLTTANSQTNRLTTELLNRVWLSIGEREYIHLQPVVYINTTPNPNSEDVAFKGRNKATILRIYGTDAAATRMWLEHHLRYPNQQPAQSLYSNWLRVSEYLFINLRHVTIINAQPSAAGDDIAIKGHNGETIVRLYGEPASKLNRWLHMHIPSCIAEPIMED